MTYPAPRLIRALRIPAGIVLLLTACGDAGTATPSAPEASDPGTSQAPASEAPDQPPGVQAALELIAQYEPVPEFDPPGPPIDLAGVEGKLIFNVPASSEIPFCNTIDDAQKQWSEEAGAEYISFTNQGQVTQYVQAINTAIAQDADVILLTCGTDPGQLAAQIQAAVDAGIQVVAGHTYDPSQEAAPNVAARMDGQFLLSGRLMAAWAIAQTNGDLNALVITDREFSSTFPLEDGINQELEANCPDCTVEFVNVDVAQWATRIQTLTQTSITGNPDLNFILPVYDSMGQFVVPAITATGADDRIQMASFNGTPFFLDMIREGDVATMDVGESLEWTAMATVDQAFRLLAGMEPVPSEVTTLRVFNDSNVNDAGVPATPAAGYGDDYISGFRELWGLGE